MSRHPLSEQDVLGLEERLLALAAANPQLIGPKPRAACPTGYWRGHKFCLHTIVKLEVLAANTGSLLMDPIQGSYSTGTAASANTHAGGGAGDLAHWNFSETNDNWIMNQARDVAFLIYWDRDAISGLWSDHGHFIDPSCPNLSAAAAAQVIDFYNGKNGLANDGPDFGSRKSVTKLWNMYLNRSKTTVASIEALFEPPKEWFEMATKADLIAALKDPSVLQAIADHVAAVRIQHPDPDRSTETIAWKTSAWSANTYAWMGFVNSREVLTVLRDFIRAEQRDDESKAAALAALETQLDELEARIGQVELPTDPEPPQNPWGIVTGPAYGVDFSGHQDYDQARAVVAGTAVPGRQHKFGIVKATEGMGFVNDEYAEVMRIFREGELLTGAYHFHWPTNTPEQDFENFVNTAQLHLGEVGVLDAENWDQKNNYADMGRLPRWEDRLDWDLQWMELYTDHFGEKPWIYMNWSWLKAFRRACGMVNDDGTVKPVTEQTELWKQLTSYKLWLADSSPVGQLPQIDGGWNAGVVAHQFTESPFDQNYIYQEDLSGLWWASGIKKGYAA